MLSIYIPVENIPEVTVEGLSIALGYLYSSVSLSSMTRSNCRAVLAAGCLLGGMEDLCHFAYEMCRESISFDTIDGWLEFVQHVSPVDGAASPAAVPVQHHYAPRLRSDVFNFLVELPTTLEVQKPDSNGREMLLQVFSRVPFEFFKGAVESPTFQIGSDQERFRFAKAAIEMRKRGRGGVVEETETVVLAFGGAPGSSVHVTRKTKKRPLFKVG